MDGHRHHVWMDTRRMDGRSRRHAYVWMDTQHDRHVHVYSFENVVLEYKGRWNLFRIISSSISSVLACIAIAYLRYVPLLLHYGVSPLYSLPFPPFSPTFPGENQGEWVNMGKHGNTSEC
jgi:hypothetical protein